MSDEERTCYRTGHCEDFGDEIGAGLNQTRDELEETTLAVNAARWIEELKELLKPYGCGGKDSFINPVVPQGFGKASFTQACNTHDACYSTAGKSKWSCDNQFKIDLRASCKGAYPDWTHDNGQVYNTDSDCGTVAGWMYLFVRGAGQSFYDAGQENANFLDMLLNSGQ